jgi:nicotinamide mononucleotide adenylyltransferase
MREEIIRACFPNEAHRLVFRAVRDYPYNDHVWTAEIQNIVSEIVEEDENAEHARIAVFGFFKDKSSYYLNLFPQWNFEEFYSSDKKLLSSNATVIREKYFTAGDDAWRELVPETVARYLDVFKTTEFFAPLASEFEYIRKYKQDTQFIGVPFRSRFRDDRRGSRAKRSRSRRAPPRSSWKGLARAARRISRARPDARTVFVVCLDAAPPAT